jgi:spore maturation protein A
MSIILVMMLSAAVLFGAASGNGAAVGAAALEGARLAADFCFRVGALICLWSGVMEVLKRSGVTQALSGLLHPVLGRLFPRASQDADTMDALSANVAANLLGLGNAATPMGIKAASGMARLSGTGVASDELCLLVVINTASIQLLPTTIAAVRAADGASAPFDILPAVWISSAASVAVGILAARLFASLSRRWHR